MKLITKLIITLFLAFTSYCKSQTKFPIQNFEFESIFGSKKSSDKKNIYCLLGQGFFKAPHSNNPDKLIENWLIEYPNAMLIPVSILKSESNFTYCWIVAGSENLNIYLVKNGCYPGGTMLRPKTWREMSKKEKKVYRKTAKPNIEVLIEDIYYKKFLKDLKEAELFAREHKLGIWKNQS